MKEKKYFNSLDKLMSDCATSRLKDHVRDVLVPKMGLTWEFVSASVEGVISRAEFLSRPRMRALCSAFVGNGDRRPIAAS
mgnify:CR=1 FL=1